MIPALRAIARAAMAARPVTLSELQARAELMARIDHSYLVPVGVFADFAAGLTDPRRPGGPFRALCVNGRRWFAYHSVYYDTPELRSFHDHRQGHRCRFKIRERVYEDSGERQFEVKLKGRRGETVKRRQPLLPGEATLGRGPRGFLASVLHGTYGIAAPEDLVPSLVTDYRRATFVADGQRITCDAGLVCRDAGTGHNVRADGGLVLVETKTAVTGRLTEADRQLHAYGLRAAEFTKYCGAMAALRPGLTADQWRRSVRTAFPRSAA
ncbi:polyphosphate polymerase domain-containing protein [Streptomyces sp. NPDC017056]|uniref:polyphosphate polymerase domain-containing protein n=1 Tax=Streptomyces sp. NPDC017056 TaxID=3364973 RepID=UPI00379FFC92